MLGTILIVIGIICFAIFFILLASAGSGGIDAAKSALKWEILFGSLAVVLIVTGVFFL